MNRFAKITLVLVTLIVLVFVSFYFAVWRPSDKDYASATASLQDLSTNMDHLDITLPSIKYPGTINGTLISYLEKLNNQYKNSLESLSKNTVVSRDMSVAPVYSKNKDSLTKYQQSVEDLVAAMKKYWSIAQSCTYLISSVSEIHTVDQFDTESKTCAQDIDGAKSAPHTVFSSKFLSKYTPVVTKLIAAYRNIVTAGQGTANQAVAKDNIESLNRDARGLVETQFNLSISSPSSQLQKIQSVVTSQNKAIIR